MLDLVKKHHLIDAFYNLIFVILSDIISRKSGVVWYENYFYIKKKIRRIRKFKVR